MAKKDNYSQDYYLDNSYSDEENPENYSGDEQDNSSKKGFFSFLTSKKFSSIFVIILVILILLVIAMFVLPLLRPDLLQKQKYSLTDPNGNNISAKVVRLSEDGNFIDAFLNDGNKFSIKMNPNQTSKVTLKVGGVKNATVKTATIVLSDGSRITLSPDVVTINEDGTIEISINPQDDLLLDEDFISAIETNPEIGIIDVTLELVIENVTEEGDKEELLIEIPMQLTFLEFSGSGCLELNRSAVFESTHNGVLELNTKLKVTCETNDALYSMLTWYSERMGNVEVLFNEYTIGSVVSQFPIELKEKLPVGTYNMKIIYSPLKEFAGQKASFDLLFGSGESEAKIIFDVVGDNLEQCVKVSAIDSIIEDESDSAIISIDASSCASQKVDIYVCDGMPSCSSASEAGVNVSSSYFSLTGSKSKTISIERAEIPGVYGVTIHARLPGLEKTFIDEKEILVKPTTELIVPERFVISLVGKEVRDVIRVKNKELAETVKVDTSICNFYDSSQGVKGTSSASLSSVSPISSIVTEDSWWRKIYSDPDTYSGDGAYQSALYGYLAEIDNMSKTIQLTTAQKTALIKQAYLDIKDIEESLTEAIDSSEDSSDAMETMNEAAQEYNDYAELTLVVSIVSFLQSAYSIINSTVMLAQINIADVKVEASSAESASGCYTGTPFLSTAAASMNAAQVLATGQLALGIKNFADLIESMTDDLGEIDTSEANNNSQEGYETALQAQEDSQSLFEYADLILDSASIDSTTSIQSDFVKTKMYLEKAKQENENIYNSLVSARVLFLAADDAITTLQADVMSESEMILAYTNLAVQALDLILSLTSLGGIVQANLNGASESLIASFEPMETLLGIGCSCCNPLAFCGSNCIYCTTCVSVIKSTTIASLEVEDTITNFGLFQGNTAKAISAIGLVTSSLQVALPLLTDFSDELVNAKAANQEVLDAIDEAVLASEDATVSIDAAIEATNYLIAESGRVSDAASYTRDLTSVSGDFDKERLTGFVATAIASGFINGAYDGGVYTTRDTTTSGTGISSAFTMGKDSIKENIDSNKISFEGILKEDCDNRVTLTLMDYIIDLVHDNGVITNTEDSVSVFWSFNDPKVFGFYESQEASLVFANGGLKKNTDGVVSLTVTKHKHDDLVNPSGDFGPLNIPDASKEELTYKYHFKFNGGPRKVSSTRTSSVCENGLLVGSTGSEALPKTLLTWEWKDIKNATTENKFLDSTQFSILLSKKLASFDDFLSRAGTSCPKNPTENIIKSIKPSDLDFTIATTCHLPLTTEEYEGKPALYYFLNNIISSASSDYDEFFDGPLPTNAEEGLALVDFNVYLMRDGLGEDFQSDFVYDYTNSILKSNTVFNSSDNGLAKYFRANDRFYFTSEAFNYESKTEYILPDAGLYRIQALIYFDDEVNPRLFNGGAMTAKIKIIPTLIQPINENHSPFYYTPFDGSVGLNVNNNRKGYGSSLFSGGLFPISTQAGSFLQEDQKYSLTKTKNIELEEFFVLNSLPSRRGKILEYNYNYTYPTNYYNDANSVFVFSPTIATPVIMTLDAKVGDTPTLTYIPKTGSVDLKPTTNNLFLLTGIKGCNDYYGSDITKTLNQTPDFLFGKTYGLAFDTVQTAGKVSAKTIAYSPTSDSYELLYSQAGKLEVTNDSQTKEKAPLEGILGMNYNDQTNNSKINSLNDIYNAVKERSICVSTASGKEIYWWPEDFLYEKENSLDKSLLDKELDEKGNCIK